MNATNRNYGQCRCCLSFGHHKNIRKKYYSKGIKEVYSDIFVECFNFHLSSNKDMSDLICISCISQLRQANAFRIKVQQSEYTLLKSLGGLQTLHVNVLEEKLEENEQKEKNFENYECFKADTANVEPLNFDVKKETSDCEENADDIYSDMEENVDSSPKSAEKDYDRLENELLSRFNRKDLVLPTRDSLYLTCFKYVSHLDSKRDQTITANDILQMMNKPIENIFSVKTKKYSEKASYIQNIATVIENSNIAPFRNLRRNGIACFYCRAAFTDIKLLRQHQSTDHNNIEEIKNLFNLYGVESLVVYVDVTDLKCTICDEGIPKYLNLKKHLETVHKMPFCTTFSDRIVPYKMSEDHTYECQICTFSFVTFGSIERHMSTHFRNYVCRMCGAGFVTKYRLKTHLQSIHYQTAHACEICKKVLASKPKLRSHINIVHKMLKRFKCSKCPERFAEYFQRQKHYVKVHGESPLRYDCNVCDRSFDKRYFLSRHMKREHLEEKDHQCEVCSYRCFTQTELRNHMVKHTGERTHECAVCKKAFARKKTLREHMRIHNNDRRFSCDVCGAAFIQKCSLKGHMKTHHFESHYGIMQ